MKNIMKFLGFIMLTMIIVFPMVSCDEEGNPVIGGGGTVTITGGKNENDKITATSKGSYIFSGFSWYYSDTEEGNFTLIISPDEAIGGRDGDEFTIPDVVNSVIRLNGKWIKAGRLSAKGTVYSNAHGPIVASEAPIPTITISGEAKQGATITATSSEATFTGNFTWQISDDGNTGWTLLSGAFEANNSKFTISGAHLGKYIRARRTSGTRQYYSLPIGPITAN